MLPSIEEALVDLEKARQFAIDSEMMGTPHKYPTDVYPEDLAYVTRFKRKPSIKL